MSGSASLTLEQGILQHTLGIAAMAFPAQVYVALCAASLPPSESVGGVEAFGGGYSRVAATFALLASPTNIAANTASVEFPPATAAWGSLGYFEIWSARTAGSRLYWGGLIDPVSGNATTLNVSVGDIVRFSAGTLAVEVAAPTTVTALGVSSFNTRTGAVILSNSDVVAALPPSANPPLMDGVAAVGTSAAWARGDHVHPTEPLSIKNFGAISDGATNDAAALNAAIAAIISTPHGGKLILPAGRTVIGSAIVANIPAGVALTIDGMGLGASELYFSNATDGLSFKLLNSGNAWGAVSLHSFTLTRGPASPVRANTGINVYADPTVNKMCGGSMSFRDLVIAGSTPLTNQWASSMILSGVSSTSVDNVTIQGANSTATDTGDSLLTITGPNANQYAANNNIINCTLQGGSVGLLITGYVQGVAAANSTIVGQYDSIRWTGGASLFAEELDVANMSLNAGHRGIYLTQVNQASIVGTTVLHFNTGVAAGFAGIEINACAFCSIASNNIVGAHTGIETGILLSGTSISNTVFGNVTTNITGTGLWLKDTTSYTTVVGNNFTAGSAGYAQDAYGNTFSANTWNGGQLTTAFPSPIAYTAPGGPRWFIGNDGSTEGGGGSNTGNNFEILMCNDAGTIIATPIAIARNSGTVTFSVAPRFSALPANFTSDAAAATGGVPIGGVYRNGSALMVRAV